MVESINYVMTAPFYSPVRRVWRMIFSRQNTRLLCPRLSAPTPAWSMSGSDTPPPPPPCLGHVVQ